MDRVWRLWRLAPWVRPLMLGKAADLVTLLTTKGGLLATKRITLRSGAAKPTVQEYDRAKHFSVAERLISGIYELAALLDDIEQRPNVFVIRGKPAEGIDRNSTVRRVHPRKNRDGTVEPCTINPAPRHWIPFDLDALPCPDWLDPIKKPARAGSQSATCLKSSMA
jgi:hypothetical protein